METKKSKKAKLTLKFQEVSYDEFAIEQNVFLVLYIISHLTVRIMMKLQEIVLLNSVFQKVIAT